jgi:16S rRNA (cytidine1402-2'-O)-methyltransferase
MLYLVATPIGNLSDITLRALETLRAVDVVASEDTRKTGMLLKHFEIQKPQISFHEHNEDRASVRILDMLAQGKNVAIVTDAGTPGIADPGYVMVQKAIAAKHEFTLIPGPTGLIMALVLSGLAVHSFTFRGFPPRKSGPRKRFFETDKAAPHTLIFYESPYRLESCLRDALEVYGDRSAALANDLTKMFEQVQRGPLSVLLEQVKGKSLKGEYILVIAGVERAERAERKKRRYGDLQDGSDDGTEEQDEAEEPDEQDEQDDEPKSESEGDAHVE